ncbi:GTP pyrophosphokinase family protein [Comamonas sp. AG1104]|uniref:GTP pyrophosphokinase n=1 Tax=Comamonas sp. AG1104 TaxID=2183900 RepID=UPI000E0BD63A|nr:RelA/SpoT family protein [Comamonas sp. AG1104]RDI10574.1 RelA/SpoT family protein [Comamonas sp. AG1104]
MTQDEFLQQWNTLKDAYQAWGRLIRVTVEDGLTKSDPSLDIASFIKIPAQPRLKADDSLLTKAFHRNKGYTDPFNQIEDKVGLRFVVLLTTEIDKIERIIEASDLWNYSLDRDFEADKESRPTEFGYQSKHYVLRAAKDVEYEGIVVPQNTPCEVQIRTLLQHAHSELTHDNIYKRDSAKEVSKEVQRAVAKSMALIEAVDDYFLHAVRALEEATKVERDALLGLQKIYEQHIGMPSKPTKSDQMVLDAFREFLSDDLAPAIEELLRAKPWISQRIKDRANRNVIYRQAWILLIYYSVNKHHYKTTNYWPFNNDDIRQIYVDFGKAMR